MLYNLPQQSFFHLNRLFLNLINKSDRPLEIKFLVVDNTNGLDLDIKNLLNMNLNVQIIPNNGFMSLIMPMDTQQIGISRL